MTQQALDYRQEFVPAGHWTGEGGPGSYPAGQYRPNPYAWPSQYAPQTTAMGHPARAYGYSVGTLGYPHHPPTNGLAIASLVLGLVSALGTLVGLLLIPFAVFGFFPGVVGSILGFVARGKARERGQGGVGMALAGAITAAVTVGLDLLLGLVVLVQLVSVLSG